MIKKLKHEWKKENKKFVKDWAMIHNKGVRCYLLTKIPVVGIMMLLIYITSMFINKEMNYLMVGIIYGFITIFAPILAWVTNETRYRKYIG